MLARGYDNYQEHFRHPNKYRINVPNDNKINENSEQFISKILLNQKIRKNCQNEQIFDQKMNRTNLNQKLKKCQQKFLNYEILPNFMEIRNFTTKKLNTSLNYLEANKILRKEADKLDLSVLENQKFILVTFGSLAKVEFMDSEILQRFYDAFKNLPYLVLWQTNSKRNKLFEIILKRNVPKNVYLMNWAPIPILLGLF